MKSHGETERVKSKVRSDPAAVQLLWLRDKKSPNLLPENPGHWRSLERAQQRCRVLLWALSVFTNPPQPARACACVCACDRPSDPPHPLPDCFIQIHPNSFGRGFTFSNVIGVVPVICSVQVFLSSPLIPPVILLAGQRSMNRNEMFQRELWK